MGAGLYPSGERASNSPPSGLRNPDGADHQAAAHEKRQREEVQLPAQQLDAAAPEVRPRAFDREEYRHGDDEDDARRNRCAFEVADLAGRGVGERRRRDVEPGQTADPAADEEREDRPGPETHHTE